MATRPRMVDTRDPRDFLLPAPHRLPGLDFFGTGGGAYVSDLLGDRVLAFDRDPKTGALTHLEAGGTEGICRPGAVVLSPDGAYVYVRVGCAPSIAICSRDPITGALVSKGGRRALRVRRPPQPRW